MSTPNGLNQKLSTQPIESIKIKRGMVGRIIEKLLSFFTFIAPGLKPQIQTTFFRMMYSALSFFLRQEDTAFLNYGYVPLNSDEPGIKLGPDDESDRSWIQLYYKVAGARDLNGKDVLEIGSGRGGGASFMARYLEPKSVTGVDLSGGAVRYCQKRHITPQLSFHQGNAENLPFSSNSMDVVVNVESSHCYPLFDQFLREVSRVMRHDGVFLFADLRVREELETMRERLEESFTIVEEESITDNVLAALKRDSDRKRITIQERAPKFLVKGLLNFASIKGSDCFRAFSTGDLQYMRYVLCRKNVSPSS